MPTVNENIDNRVNKVIFITFFSLFAIPAPFYTATFAILLYCFSKKSEWIYLFIIGVVLMFSNMNLYKEIWAFGDYLGVGNDLGWYSTQWFSFADHPYGFLSIFDDDYLIFINDGFLVKPKISEPIYHSYSYFFSRITDGNYIFFVYTLTFFIYIPAGFVIYKVLKLNQIEPLLVAMVLLFFLFFSMKFTNMFNMIRHYCSGSFLIITLYFLYVDKVKLAFLFSLLACLTHNAAVVVIAMYFLVFIIDKNSSFTQSRKVMLTIFFVSLLSSAYLLVYNLTFTNYEELNDRGSGYAFKILDLVIIILSVVAYSVTSKSSLDKLWLYYIGVVVLIIFMHLTNFLQLRYYAYFDYFRWIGVVYLFNLVFSLFKFKALIVVVSFFSFLSFLWFRVYISDFDFDGLLHNYFILRYS
ncbi:EpsG family protein [Vibrio sinaloensis]|uniref:EpsG family protein n=1 Tax=Photobacterium sp. (strain ATCC 43367) TaxID=379097 RepID=UPI0009E39B3E|nr:EpsG family protein [Vibrio sinaloensis]